MSQASKDSEDWSASSLPSVVGTAGPRHEYKLFLGQMPHLLTEKGLEEILAPFGRPREIVVLRDRHGASRGCAFASCVSRTSPARSRRSCSCSY